MTDTLGKRKSKDCKCCKGSEQSQEFDHPLKCTCPALEVEDVTPLLVLPARLPAKGQHPLLDDKCNSPHKRSAIEENLVDTLISDLVCYRFTVFRDFSQHIDVIDKGWD